MMKKLPIYLLILTLFSCGGDPETSKATRDLEITYEIDTVMVDPGDHFFFLNWGLGIADVSADKKMLFNLNPQTFLLEIVDLDALALKETVQLEKEGPNGVGGGFISKLQVLDNGNLLLFDFQKIFEITPKGELVRSYEFDKSKLSGYDFGETDEVETMGIFSPDGKRFIGQLTDEDFKKPAKGLAFVNTETMEIQVEETDAISKLDEYRIMFEMGGNSMMSTGEQVFMDVIAGDFVFSNTGFNEIYVYDFDADSLIHYQYQAQLSSNERILDYPQRVESREALMEVMKEKNEQVRFGPLIPQPDKNLIWRLTKDKDRMIADSVIYKNVVTVFDSDYQMLHEEVVEKFPGSNMSFFKNGMLYAYINLDDEMAFVRVKPSISE
ncbi:DUF4221 family protein [uncultured Algoriphagus sp.]|uniref:DUF4221 family protein n=1 Tax=uncultured Algoriphagus sp. TaxID=417365 RepID=UPI0025924BDC|nr:DUF4221 family protein [uncultured Algoriphagus sp.]